MPIAVGECHVDGVSTAYVANAVSGFVTVVDVDALEILANVPVTLAPDGASGLAKLVALNHDKLNMILPRGDVYIPWTALIIGLWIPNFYYWGLNQYIIQRTLGSHSLAEGQKGTVFAAGLKLLIPFVIVFPGIMAFNLFSDDMAREAARDPQIIQGNQRAWERFEQVQQDPAGAGLDRPQDHLPVLLLGGAEHALQVAHPAGEYMSAPASLSARDDLAASAVRLTTPPGCRA